MITINNTAPIENKEDWEFQRATLHISPDITDRVVWKMSFWETNGFDSRIIDIFPVYYDIDGEEGPLKEVVVSVNLKDPHLVNLELAHSGFIEVIMPGGDHHHLAMVLGLADVGIYSFDLGDLCDKNRIAFYFGVLEHLTYFGVEDIDLTMDDVYEGFHEALLLEDACVNARI